MSDNPIASHWLVNAATRAGLEADPRPEVPPGASLAVAWREVCSGFGVRPAQLAEAVARTFRLEVADLGGRDSAASRLLTEELARKFLVIPVRQTDRALFVATGDPSDFDAESEIRFISGRDTQFEVAPPEDILQAINETWGGGHREMPLLTNRALDDATAAVQIMGVIDSGAGAPAPTKGPAVKVTNLILFEAARAGAQAVLLEPQRKGGRVRIKTPEGVSTLLTLPRAAMGRTVERIRELAGYGGNGSTLGTKGAIDAVISGVPYKLRVARTTEGGEERILIHMADPGSTVDRTDSDAASGDPRPLVLVVDDDESARVLLRTVLEGSGFRVIEAEDGPPALDLLEKEGDIALVVLDLMMPEMHGLEVLKRIRATVRTVGLPVVVMTASENPKDELALFEAGADDYLHKPVHPPRMIVRIRAVLRRAGVHVEH